MIKRLLQDRILPPTNRRFGLTFVCLPLSLTAPQSELGVVVIFPANNASPNTRREVQNLRGLCRHLQFAVQHTAKDHAPHDVNGGC